MYNELNFNSNKCIIRCKNGKKTSQELVEKHLSQYTWNNLEENFAKWNLENYNKDIVSSPKMESYGLI